MTAAPPAIASWTKPSDIYTLTIEKGSNTYGLEGGFIQFDYFESIFSPHISGNLVIADTGFGVEQGALISALQITGNEKIRVLINHPSGSLDFDDDIHHFIVDSIKDLGSNENTKITSFRVVSKYEKKNKITSVEGAYDNNIRNSFQEFILKKDILVFIFIFIIYLFLLILFPDQKNESLLGKGYISKISLIIFESPIYIKIFTYISFFISYIIILFYINKNYVELFTFLYFIFLSLIIWPILQEYFDPILILLVFTFFNSNLNITYKNVTFLYFYLATFLIGANIYY